MPPLPASSIPGGEHSERCFAPTPQGWPALLLDGVHNSHAFASLIPTLEGLGLTPGAVIFSCLGDKEPEGLVPYLLRVTSGPIFIPPIEGNPRAMDPKTLAALIGPRALPAPSLPKALRAAAAYMAQHTPEAFIEEYPDRPLLVCGSLYLLGQFYALRPDCLEE